jgi:hypothetical protein
MGIKYQNFIERKVSSISMKTGLEAGTEECDGEGE